MAIPKQTLAIGIGATSLGAGGIGVYYLSQDKTIRDKLVSQGEKLIETDLEYEVSFKELKGESEFITELKKNTNNIENNSSLQEGREALKKWCDANLKLNLTKDNDTRVLPKVKKYCTKRPITIKAKYEVAGRRLVSDWQTKLTSLKKEITSSVAGKDDTLVNDLQVGNNGGLDGAGVSGKLQQWCNDNIETKLNQTTSDEIWKKVEKRCLEKA